MSTQNPPTGSLTQSAYQLADARALVVIVYHRAGVSTAPLGEGGVVIGRMPPADLVIDDPSLSRRHARLTREDGTIVVHDLGSTNGTWRSGENVTRTELEVGDEVVLGSVVCCVRRPADSVSARLGMRGHDDFVEHVETEVLRCQFFRRTFTLLMLRRTGGEAHVRHWAGDVGASVRPVDELALFSEDTVELCLAELGEPDAEALIDAVQGAVTGLSIGRATFPEDGRSAAALISACHDRLVGHAPEARIASNEAIVCASDGMRETLETARLLSRGVIPVLLQGETGVGKEVVARFIHAQGPRKDGPFIALNCGAIPTQLVESTLFGHEKGAFTGAANKREGVFEAAADGTLFLDEIGELPASAQAALLRVLETKTIVRVGATKEIGVSARIVAASHRDLEAMTDDGLFRKDLLFRLNAMTVRIPPLRERRGDIAALAKRFLEVANADAPSPISAITPDALHALDHHGWPGNVRELKNAIERGVLIARHGRITREELPERIRNAAPHQDVDVQSSSDEDPNPERSSETPSSEAPSSEAPSKDAPSGDGVRALSGRARRDVRYEDESYRAFMERVETDAIVTVLAGCNWNKAEAARRLSMPRRTLVHRIKALGITRPTS